MSKLVPFRPGSYSNHRLRLHRARSHGYASHRHPLPTGTPTPAATPTATAVEAPKSTFYLEPGTRADARTYGGQLIDWGFDILLLDDGGTLIVGRADNPRPSHRIWTGKARVIRTDAEGDLLWQKD